MENTDTKRKREVETFKLEDIHNNVSQTHNPDTLLRVYKCTICLQTMDDPSTLPCDHIYCFKCIQKTINKSKNGRCPQCREPCTTKDIRKSRNFREMIKELKYECLANECPWMGPSEKYNDHIANECKYLYLCGCSRLVHCKDTLDHNEICEWYYITCKKCSDRIPRTSEETHINEFCKNSTVQCTECYWSGKRSLVPNHIEKCKVTILKKENAQLKLSKPKQKDFDVYKRSDGFIVSGLYDPNDEERAKTVRKYYLSYFDHKFPKTYGSVDTNDITICNIVNDSLLVVKFDGRLTGYAKIDISDEEGVMMITLNGKHNRFIIFRSKTKKPVIEECFDVKGIGRINVKIPYSESELLEPSLMVYANRLYIWCKDMIKEYPFEIDKAIRHYTEFTLMVKKELRESILKDLKTFFNIE